MTRVDTRRGTECPDEEVLAGLIEGRVAGVERAALERHLAGCARCLDTTVAAMPSAGQSRARRVGSSPAATIPAARPPRVAGPAPLGRSAVPRGRRGRRLARAAALALAVGIVGIAGARVAVDRGRAEIARRVGDAIGTPLAIGDLAFELRRDLPGLAVALGDLRLGGLSEPPATVELVEASIALIVPWRGGLVLERVRLLRPSVRLRGDAWPLLGGAGRHGGRVIGALVDGPALQIVEGVLVIERAGARPLRVEGIEGTVTPVPDGLRIALAGAAADGPVSAAATLRAGAGGAVAGEGTLVLSPVLAGALRAAAPALGGGPDPGGPTVVRLELTGDAAGLRVAPRP